MEASNFHLAVAVESSSCGVIKSQIVYACVIHEYPKIVLFNELPFRLKVKIKNCVFVLARIRFHYIAHSLAMRKSWVSFRISFTFALKFGEMLCFAIFHYSPASPECHIAYDDKTGSR